MSDGIMTTTAQAISPVQTEVTEADMSKVRMVFDRAVNALVDASSLRNEVEDLRNSLQGLQEQIEKVRYQNDWLDEQLVRIRQERDSAITDANSAKASREGLQNENERVNRELEDVKSILEQDKAKFALLKQEHDDAQMQVLELEEKLSKALSKIEKFLALADEIEPPEEPSLSIPVEIPPHSPIANYDNSTIVLPIETTSFSSEDRRYYR